MNITRAILGLVIAIGCSGTAVAQFGNTAYGSGAFASNVTGNYNSAFGQDALNSNTIGNSNTVSGYQAMLLNYSGSSNTAVGYYALYYGNGTNNIALGDHAGLWVTGSNNIHIGHPGISKDNNVIRIGKQSVQKFTAIAGISGVNVTGGAVVVVNKTGQLGVELSSIRYKQNVHSMGTASERLLKLRPVTFRYKQAAEDGSNPEQYGLIAEEVARVMPELVIYNDKGQPETVAYQTLTPMLLNELQREHNQLERAQAELVAMRGQRVELDALRAEVDDLRRVTAQLTDHGSADVRTR